MPTPPRIQRVPPWLRAMPPAWPYHWATYTSPGGTIVHPVKKPMISSRLRMTSGAEAWS